MRTNHSARVAQASAFHYEVRNFDHLLGVPGFSDKLLTDHFKLYEAYVKNVNQLNDFFASIKNAGEYKSSGLAESRRRFGWEFNGMRLHEYYFENMKKEAAAIDRQGELWEKISDDFGSYEKWREEFTSLGAMRGIGWVLLMYDYPSDRLFNVWVNEHDTGILAGAASLLVMDVFEHAFLTDYGLDRGAYIAAFMKAIDWAEVENRFGGLS